MVEWDTVDIDHNQQKYALIRFDNIFGSGAGQIPVGSTIVSAGLTYYVTNATANAPSSVNGVLVDWTEATSYNTFGAAPGVQVEDYGAQVTTAPATTINTAYTIDVKTSVAAWANNPATNKGWIIIPTADDGVAITSSEGSPTANRPKLTVQYYPPAVAQYTLTVTTSGNGTVTKTPDQPLYNSGASVILAATPTAGWEFTGWSGGGCSGIAPCTVTMDADKTVTATFTQIPADLLRTDAEPHG